MWAVDVRLDEVLDLREAATRETLGLPDGRWWVLDRDRCLALARSVRTGSCGGLIVPSVALLDQPERWNAVVFAESLRTSSGTALRPGQMVVSVSPS